MLEQAHQKPIHVDLGRLVATPNALEALVATGVTPAEFLARHQRGDWGELDWTSPVSKDI